jgi:hypothetical protein
VSAWVECLKQSDPVLVRACLESRLDPDPNPGELAGFLCLDERDRNLYDLHVILVSEALARIPSSQALDWIDQVQLGCRRYQESSFLIKCLAQREKDDPAWIAGLRETLTPDRLFSPEAGEAGIQLTTFFLKKGDLQVRQWIEAGARGEWGGTPEQIDRAIGISLTVQDPGTPRLSHLRSVIASASVPAGGATGSTFVHALLDANAWPDRDSAKALDTLMSVLYDDRFQESAAATLCLTMPVDPQKGCDPATWLAIRARALEIANQIGLVMPGSKH